MTRAADEDTNPSPLTGRTVLFAHPSAELYGSDRVLLESIQAVVDAGARVIVTLPETGPLAPLIHDLGADVACCPTPVLRKSMLKPRGMINLLVQTIRGSIDGRRLLRSVRPDLVYVNTLTIPLWVVLGRVSRTRVICHVHEAEGSASRLLQRALNAPVLLAHQVVINSRFSMDVLAKSYSRLAVRSTIVYNGVVGPPHPQRGRPKLNGPLKILYLGRLSARKGVDIAVDAVAQLRDRGLAAHLDIVGAVFPGYEWYRDQLIDQVTRYGLATDITFHGFHSSIWPFLSDCDVVVVPSRLDEPFGNTAVEAILGARPAVTSNTSGLREAAGGYRSSVLISPSDPSALADALQSISDDWPTVREKAWLDRAQAVARHSPERYRRRIAAIVDDALEGRPQRAVTFSAALIPGEKLPPKLGRQVLP
ncbi:glycosyltransferase family 4 protein [Leifsonia sp. Root112D2]|uniref:glycosyltransferase family 4 protein n=1 Tax=Leifsonia sp. Root112D2 TaxID=1736426 RepID=UPI0009E82BA5|nr:glycosyltransferase family 4 protein [Leifsonia sp. Root112D2]